MIWNDATGEVSLVRDDEEVEAEDEGGESENDGEEGAEFDEALQAADIAHV